MKKPTASLTADSLLKFSLSWRLKKHRAIWRKSTICNNRKSLWGIKEEKIRNPDKKLQYSTLVKPQYVFCQILVDSQRTSLLSVRLYCNMIYKWFFTYLTKTLKVPKHEILDFLDSCDISPIKYIGRQQFFYYSPKVDNHNRGFMMKKSQESKRSVSWVLKVYLDVSLNNFKNFISFSEQKALTMEWVKFLGKIKKGCVIIPDDNITW